MTDLHLHVTEWVVLVTALYICFLIKRKITYLCKLLPTSIFALGLTVDSKDSQNNGVQI